MRKQLSYAQAMLLAFTLCCVNSSQASEPPMGTGTTPSKDTGTCRNAGPLACAATPLSSLDDNSKACDLLRKCVVGKQDKDDVIEAISACEKAEITQIKAMPAIATMQTQVVIVNPSNVATYLWINTEHGWCPADTLQGAEWTHGGYCEHRFDLHWTTSTKPVLRVVAQRLCRIPLDQAEIASGESDIASLTCTQKDYRWDNGGLIKLEQSEQDRACLEF